MFAGLFGILLITTAAAQSCPASQVASDAQITLYADSIVPETAVRGGALPDPNLMFFSDVLGYNDDEIQQEVQNALQFYSDRFGLDFSLTEPNELGQRFFQNATLQPIRETDRIIFAVFNRWILTGNTRSRCFRTLLGGLLVTFSGEQILKGTYGGEEGIEISTDRYLTYEYGSTSVPPCEPIVILYRTPIPLRFQGTGATTRLTVVFLELSHPTLGQGAQAGFIQTERITASNGTSFLRFYGTGVLTFPPNVLTFNQY